MAFFFKVCDGFRVRLAHASVVRSWFEETIGGHPGQGGLEFVGVQEDINIIPSHLSEL